MLPVTACLTYRISQEMITVTKQILERIYEYSSNAYFWIQNLKISLKEHMARKSSINWQLSEQLFPIFYNLNDYFEGKDRQAFHGEFTSAMTCTDFQHTLQRGNDIKTNNLHNIKANHRKVDLILMVPQLNGFIKETSLLEQLK
ncbi:hypothetical protein GQX74_001728 [Glossina fuscipes]|nr:hypothetical protein GQX74_001728 [Glossina fuscipes]